MAEEKATTTPTPRNTDEAKAIRTDFERKQDWADKSLIDGSVFERRLKTGVMKDLAGFEPYERAKAESLEKMRYAYDTDNQDLQNIEDPNKRYEILGRRVGNAHSDWLTNSNVVSNLKGQVGDIVGSGVQAFIAKAQLAQNQADRGYRDWQDNIQQGRMDEALALQKEIDERNWNYQVGRDKIDDERWERQWAKANGGSGGGGGGDNSYRPRGGSGLTTETPQTAGGDFRQSLGLITGTPQPQVSTTTGRIGSGARR